MEKKEIYKASKVCNANFTKLTGAESSIFAKRIVDMNVNICIEQKAICMIFCVDGITIPLINMF